ncbi:MAG: replication-associated protein [Cressdnaviricota sp.]|nr:MAG: replication-associated protein [Cressdnaviricota sp.]
MSRPHKTWKWTLNNYDENDIKLHHLWSEDCKRMRAAKEVGKNGTPHIQACATFNRAMRLSALKKMNPRIHWEPAKVIDCLYEAKHDGDVFINLDNRRQGERSDLTELTNDIKDPTMDKKKLWLKHPEAMMKFHRGAYEMMNVVRTQSVSAKYKLNDFPKWTPITDWSRSHIIWGPAGVGKTQFALAHFSNPLFVSHVDDLKTFNNDYDGIVFDDMCFAHIPRTAQIHLVDIDTPRSIHIRYGCARIPANTKKIFTTNEEHGEIFDLLDGAIARRVTVTEVSER